MKKARILLLCAGVVVLWMFQTAQGIRLSGIVGNDFSVPYFPSAKPNESYTGGQWGLHEDASTHCLVTGTGASRHAEITLDLAGRTAGLWYSNTEPTLPGGAWRIYADIRGILGEASSHSPARWFYLTEGDQNATVVLAMKFYPNKTVEWITPTQNGTFTSPVGVDTAYYRRVHFDYDPTTGRASGGLGNEVVFNVVTTAGLMVKTVAFSNSAATQGTGTYFIDNIGSDTIAIPGDVNGDGFVDSLDADIVNQNRGLGPLATWKQGDVSGNGYVDSQDLEIVSANLNTVQSSLVQSTGIIPEPQLAYNFNSQRYSFAVSAATTIVLDTSAGDLEKKGAALLQDDFQTLYGMAPGIVYQSLGWGKRGFVLCNNVSQVAAVVAHLQVTLGALPVHGEESYRLVGDCQGLVLDAPAAAGLFYGMQTLRQMLRSDRTIPALAIADWPDQAMRAFYVGLPTDPEGLVKKLARLKVNLCIVESRWYAGGNWWYNPYGNNRTEADQFISLCKQYNIEPVPLVQGFGWAYGVVDINANCAEGIWTPNESHTLSGTTPVNFGHPNVLRSAAAPITVSNTAKTVTYTEGTDYQIIPGVTARLFPDNNTPWKIARISGGRITSGQTVLVNYNYMNYCPSQSPYCPSEPLTYQIVDDTLTNVVNIWHPKYIHIGHDEVIYVRRCSRCLNSGKTAVQLIGSDITHWYNKLKALDPNIKIMIWDDLLRQDATNGSAISSVPGDVIIFPWLYGSGERSGIDGRLNWFVTTNQRPTMGVCSGYWHDNIWQWKDAVSSYSGNSNCRGFMFSHWGEGNYLLSGLSFAAEYMWSRGKPDSTMFNLLVQMDQNCRAKGLGLTLSLWDQRETVAQLVNDATAVGRDARGDADTLSAQLTPLADQIRSAMVPELALSDTAAGTIPERGLTQAQSLPAYWWSMGAWVQAKHLHDLGDKPGATAVLNQIVGRFTQWHFKHYENADSWKTNYANGNVFPTCQQMFDVNLNTL